MDVTNGLRPFHKQASPPLARVQAAYQFASLIKQMHNRSSIWDKVSGIYVGEKTGER